ncbi:alpha amylase N-terminal ig-like domain-containing protein [Candidatus Acetothermia bacterium]|nr:alpha amylase N-terminal ig-like domain-containing protein [Candidatus Acetothermia bacterium]
MPELDQSKLHARLSKSNHCRIISLLGLIGALIFVLIAGLAGTAQIRTAFIEHNTHNLLFRYPFGAVPTGTEIRLRIRVGIGDAEAVTISYWDHTQRIRKMRGMEIVGHSPDRRYDYWEVRLISETPTVLWYHFIIKGSDKTVYYGDPGQDGGTGRVVLRNPDDFQLTIYCRYFRTPDWMKNAITYQIFLDRFYDGDPTNNQAADKRGFRGGTPLEHREWGQLPDNPREKGVNPAYDGDGIWNNDFFGGDLAGVIAQLDYLSKLGVGVIYLNPIFEAASNHKFDHGDYRNIDRAFGDNALFKELARRARERGIHLILDASFNHVGDDSRYFDRYNRWPNDIGAYEYWSAVFDLMAAEGLSQAAAEKRVRNEFITQGLTDFTFTEWFEVRNRVVNVDGVGVYGAERYDYPGWWGLESMPVISAPGGSELNLTSFADYTIRAENSIARQWIRYGSSGWRLDVSPDVAHDFWAEFRTYIRNMYFPHGMPIMIAENWHDATLDLLGDTFDSTMNYRFRNAVIEFVLHGDAYHFDRTLTEIYEDYPAEAFYVMMNLIESHDTERILKTFGYVEIDTFADRERVARMRREEIEAANALALARVKMMAIFKFSYPGSPTIYYGTEVGLPGHRDPDCRRTFPWERVTEENVLLNHYRRLAAIRNENPVLRIGNLITLHAQGRTYVIGRRMLGDTDALGRSEYTINYHTGEMIRIAEQNALAIVAISRTGEMGLRLDLSQFVRDGALFVDLLNNGQEYVVVDGGITLDLPPWWGAILIARHGPQDLLPPEPPSDLVAVSHDRRVELTWKPVADALFYNVYRTTIIGGHYERIATGLIETSFTDLGVENLRRYFYTVTAVDKAGNESPFSGHVAAVPSLPLDRITILPFDLLGEEHIIGVGRKIEPVVVAVYMTGVTDLPGRGKGISAQFGFGQDPDPTTWVWIEADYSEDQDKVDIYVGRFVPEQLGKWFVSLRFSTNDGMSWRIATYPDGTLPWFTVIPTDDLTPPAVPHLDPATTLHRLDTPSFVVLQWEIPDRAGIDHLQVLRQRGDRPWEELTRLAAGATSFLDQRVAHGQRYRYQVITVDRSFNRAHSNVIEVTPGLLPLTRVSPIFSPLGEVSPMIDGTAEIGEWEKAARFTGEGLMEQAFIGYGTHNLYLRVDTVLLPTELIGEEYRLVLYIGFHTGANPGTPINARTRFAGEELGFPLIQLVQARFDHIRPDGRGHVFRFVADGMEGWRFDSDIRLLLKRIVRVDETIEIQVPFAELGLDRTEELTVWMRLAMEKAGKIVGTAPLRPVIARLPALVGGEVIASFTDPVGDDHGMGTFVYPTAGVFDVEGLFDLLSYTIFDQGDKWLLAFEFAALPNPWGGPHGFSHPIINLYFDVQPGGLTEAHPEGDAMQVRFHPDHPWDLFIKVAGWPEYGRHLFTVYDEMHLIDVSADPARRLVLVRIPKELMPEIRGAHYVMIASQDGFGPDHIRPVARTAGEWIGGGNPAPPVAPLVFDYLAPEGYSQEDILSGFDVMARTFAVLVPIILE